MNEHKVSVNILTTEQTDSVLEKACSLLSVPENLVYCFALFLIRRDEDGDITILRKLQDFESPYISQKALATPTYLCQNAGKLELYCREMAQQLKTIMDDMLIL